MVVPSNLSSPRQRSACQAGCSRSVKLSPAAEVVTKSSDASTALTRSLLMETISSTDPSATLLK
eukprot:6258753-Amphidinium_carterae.1